MNTRTLFSRRLPIMRGAVLLALLSALNVAGCSTHVGEHTGVAPQAIITPIGNIPTSAAGANPVTITVRSGADVVMSAKDSNGYGFALTGFQWKQTSGPPLPGLPDPGALLYRSADTVSFRAPQVTSATPLGFAVTVTNEQGASSTTSITVTVEQANDPNQFLIAPNPAVPGHANRFVLAVTTLDGFGTTASAPLTADVPVCLQIARQISYLGRDATTHTTPAGSLSPVQADTAWSAGTVVAGAQPAADADIQNAVQSYSNPRAVFEIPTFNDEDLFALYNQPSNAQLSLQLVPSDVDSATLSLAIGATPGSCDGTKSAPALANRPLIVAILDSSGQVVQHSSAGAALRVTADSLLGSLGTQPIQTAESARAYYSAIDPNAFTSTDSKSTFTGWLTANCFDPASSDYGTGAAGTNGAHAVYTNNYDLGFGRDMYFIACTADHKDANGSVTAHKGDMASVVINYPSLEQTALKDGQIIAVAMEYSAAADGSGRRFPKFYVYAPDDRTGDLKRVLSANFDRRGHKYVPGACTVCHGGNLPSLPPGFTGPGASGGAACAAGSAFDLSACYPLIHDPTTAPTSTCTPTSGSSGCLAAGDVDSAFLLWDADAFLYSAAPATANQDPAFKGNLVGPAPYTRQAQEPAIRALNMLAHATFQPEIETVPNGGTSSVQVDRFAAARTLVEQWYGGSGFPQSTYADFTDASPPAGWKAQSSKTPLYQGVFARNCRTCHTVNADPTKQFSGLLPNLTGDGYPLFVNTFTKTPQLGQSYVFQKGIMPMARLTMDRFWINFTAAADPSQAGAGILAADLGLSGSAMILGTPHPLVTASINGNNAAVEASLSCGATSSNTLGRNDTVRLSGAPSDFALSNAWTLTYTSCDPRFASKAALVGKQTSEAAFSPDRLGCTRRR